MPFQAFLKHPNSSLHLTQEQMTFSMLFNQSSISVVVYESLHKLSLKSGLIQSPNDRKSDLS
jgi:hypothetical protein